jgi:predicted ABC-type ATPase
MKNLYIISGSIGSGKSTFASLLFENQQFLNIEFVRADVYKKYFFNIDADLK